MPETNTQFIIPPPPVSSIAVVGTDARFPVRRIICVGRNYAAHAREMGRDPDREPPFFFQRGEVMTGGIDGVGEIKIAVR
jgi:fumarylpyruvate hydrolase